ncbi:MAG: hypothetical protein JWP07_1785, partial [Pseudonocardiales bacterium]|nr:hypothetical protein [Pseudonocardiales bacterium]
RTGRGNYAALKHMNQLHAGQIADLITHLVGR